MDLKAELKALAKASGMDFCGVASIDRFETAPPELHPSRVLPGCKSVIVIGVRLLDGIIQANFRDFEDGQADLKGLYGTYGYTMLPNFELTYACYRAAQFIERETGKTAVPCSTGPMTNGRQVSLRHCAVAAGLGEFGWMSIVLTPEFGPRNRWGAILTTAELEPDPLYSGPKLCNPEKCGICTKVCPSGALSRYDDPEKPARVVKMGDKEYHYCHVDMAKCYLVEHKMLKKYGGSEDYVDENATVPEMTPALKSMAQLDMGIQDTPSWYCGRCLSYCPAGKWGEKFSATGLSRGFTASMDTLPRE